MSFSKKHFTALHCMVSFQVTEVNIHSVSDCETSQSESRHLESWQTIAILKICGTGAIRLNSLSVRKLFIWIFYRLICNTL